MKRTKIDPRLPRADEDSPWKEILDRYLRQLLEFLFPEVSAEIDWSCGYQSLDTELQRITRDAKIGRLHVDKLVKVRHLSGEDVWLLIHLEVQAYVESEFPERMFGYHVRLYIQHREHAVSLAILADDDTNWRPDRYRWGRSGNELTFRFPTVKLLDYADRMEELDRSENPFALLVKAHLKAHSTRGDAKRRFDGKVELARELYAKGYERQEVLDLLRFIDRLIALPPEMETTFREEVERIEQETKMAYIPTYAREAHNEGLQKGIQQGIQQGFQEGSLQASRDAILNVVAARFGSVPDAVVEAVHEIGDADRLTDLLRSAAQVSSVDRFQQSLTGAS